ncbi:MAG: ABC transporter ATP-binding protein [Planctomycetota bacterium]|nr:ABC transporter ATP-binding protein [Planctomycetota bacterium]
MSAPPSIRLKDVRLTYRLYSNRRPSLKLSFLSALRGGVEEHQELHALRGVSLEIRPGDRVGLIGPNGAGKTTMLRLLAGIFPPSAGTVEVSGFTVPLFRMGLGFEAEITGEENVVQAGALLGISAKQMRERAEQIFEFAELKKFRNSPLKYYSRGMVTRLAFGTVCEVDPEILLLDEVFGGGDMSFREKAVKRMQELILRTPIVVMVSHSMATVRDVANRVIWLQDGEIRMDGDPEQVISAYEASVN